MSVGCFVDGPVEGLRYESRSTSGFTGPGGAFEYVEGEDVVFSLGEAVLGTTPGRPAVTPADLFTPRGDLPAILDRRVVNCARLLQSLGGSQDISAGVSVDEAVRSLAPGVIDFDATEEDFSAQSDIAVMLDKLGVILRSPVVARNHLRRSMAGIKKLEDVRVPIRDGSYLLADVFRPIMEGRYPVIMRLSIYGRAFGAGSVCSEADRAASEQREDDWFTDRPSGLSPMVRYAENAVSANAFDWVGRGYVLVRVDARGVGLTPGELRPFSRQEAEDYYDAIEWAAQQPWCSGAVGLLGASYAATNQWNVAALQPPALRAMIPWASDADAYRDLAYPGGILQTGYRRNWWSFVTSLQCQLPSADFVSELEAHPFDDPDFYGAASEGPRSADFDRVRVPFLTAVSQTATLHARAGFEAFRAVDSVPRQLVVVAANYFSFLYRECLSLQFDFFDRFLKRAGIGPEAPSAVRLMMRTGGGDYEWRDEPDWPIPDTSYQRWFLDAAGERRPGEDSTSLSVQRAAPGAPASISYPAAWEPPGSRADTGASFVSRPLEEALWLAGHFRARLWVSATSSDMDVFVALRVLASDGTEIRYAVRDRTSEEPLTWGCLKASHRALDPERSAVRPWHTHLRDDIAPLNSAQDIVELDIEMMPATAVIPAGSRLRVDVQPVEGPGGYRDANGQQVGRAYDLSYHRGTTNTVHTGGDRSSHIVLPVVPNPAAPAGSRM